MVNGSGSVNGYGTVTFSEGSELWTKYTGTVFPREGSKMLRKGTYIVVGGKGRYAGAKGDGTWEGDGAPIGSDAITYIDNITLLTLKNEGQFLSRITMCAVAALFISSQAIGQQRVHGRTASRRHSPRG
jgi:hypothetical protein